MANNDKMVVGGNCVFCGKAHSVEVGIKAFAEWKYGNKCIQNAMPEVSADDREFLISGICPTCFEKCFG